MKNQSKHTSGKTTDKKATGSSSKTTEAGKKWQNQDEKTNSRPSRNQQLDEETEA